MDIVLPNSVSAISDFVSLICHIVDLIRGRNLQFDSIGLTFLFFRNPR